MNAILVDLFELSIYIVGSIVLAFFFLAMYFKNRLNRLKMRKRTRPEIKVIGNEIIYGSRLESKNITFDSITKIESDKKGFVILYSGDKKLLSINPDSIGYSIFEARLRQEGFLDR